MGRLAGVYAYLTKPFKTDQLVTVIQTSLEDTVPSSEGAMRQGEHEMASSEDTTRSQVPVEVFSPRQHGMQVNIEQKAYRRMGHVHEHTGEPQ